MLCGYLAYTSVLELLSFHIRTDISTISMWQIRKHTQQIRKHTRTNADLWMNMLRRIRETMWRIHSDVQQYASQYSDDTRGYAGSLESVGACVGIVSYQCPGLAHFYIHVTFESKWPSIHSLKSLPPFFCTMASRDNQGRRLRAGLTSLLLACCRGTLACAHVEPRCFFRWSTTSWTSTRIFFIRFARDDRRPFHRRTKCMKK